MITDLVSDPNITALGGVTLDVGLDKAVREGILSPTLLEEGDVKLLSFNPSRLANDRAKEVVIVLSLLPPESALLGSSGDAARQGLVDVNALDAIFAFGVLDGEGNGADANSLSLEPANALQLQDSIGALVAESLVLHGQKDDQSSSASGTSASTDHDPFARDVEDIEISRGGHNVHVWGNVEYVGSGR